MPPPPPLPQIPTGASRLTALHFSRDGRTLLAGTDSGSLRAYPWPFVSAPPASAGLGSGGNALWGHAALVAISAAAAARYFTVEQPLHVAPITSVKARCSCWLHSRVLRYSISILIGAL